MDYDTVYTIEFNGDKGWEVWQTYTGLTEAINEFRACLLGHGVAPAQWRLTTPKPVLL